MQFIAIWYKMLQISDNLIFMKFKRNVDNMIRTSKINRRYRLHQKLKRAGLRYSAMLRTIYVPWDFEMENDDLKELQNDFSYQIQFEI